MTLPFKFPEKDTGDQHLVTLLFLSFKFFILNLGLVFDKLNILLKFLFLLSHINKLHKFLFELVECNICFEIPTARTKIRQCINGHLICNSCYTEYNNLRSRELISETLESRHQPRCPFCRTTQIGIRSLIAEKLVAKLTENDDFPESDISNRNVCSSDIPQFSWVIDK